jgi:hypothetical protein
MAGTGSAKDSGKRDADEGETALAAAFVLLEDVGRALVAAPRSLADLRPIAREVAAAIGALADAADARRDPLDATRTAIVACDEARLGIEPALVHDPGLAEVKIWLERARGWLVVVERNFETRRATVRPAPGLLAPSGPLPALHDVARASIAPVYAVAEPLEPPAPPRTIDPTLPPKQRLVALKEASARLRQEAAQRRDERRATREARERTRSEAEATRMAPGLVPGVFSAKTDAEVRKERARDLMLEVAGMGAQRTPLLGDYWRSVTVFDRRMWNAVDAIAALGEDGVLAVEPLFWDLPAKDGPHVFGACFTLGCFAGRDTLLAIERIVRAATAADPSVLGDVVHALTLAPHDGLVALAEEWLTRDLATLRAAGVEILAHRGALSLERLVTLAGDADPLVATAALLGVTMHPDAARGAPGLSDAVERHADAKAAPLRAATAWATLLGGVAYPLDRLRKRLAAGELDAVAVPFALAADRSDCETLTKLLDGTPTRALIEALGYLGDPTTLPRLVALLEDEATPPEVVRATTFALQRITGAELYEEAELAPDLVDPEDPPDPPLPGQPLASEPRRGGRDRDPPSAGAKDSLRLPTSDPARWRAFLVENDVVFQGERRLRRGQPYTPERSLEELDTFQITPEERRTLHREIALKTGHTVPLHVGDFVVKQEAALRALGPICRKASSHPGAWGYVER